MKKLQMSDVMASIDAVPALPAVVADLIKAFDSEEIDMATLCRKIELDQALTARTLRLANSSFFGMQKQIGTVGEAVSVLGMRNLHSLVMTAALIGGLGVDTNATRLHAQLWRHALGSALCARALAAQVGLGQEYAYTLGLLHDIGRLILVTQFADAYGSVTAYRDKHDCYAVEAENAVLGFDHARVGEALAAHWKFPDHMQKAVAYHHRPDHPAADDMTLLVHLADAIAHALDFDGDPDNLVPRVEQSTWQLLDIDAGKLRVVLEDAEQRFQANCVMLG